MNNVTLSTEKIAIVEDQLYKVRLRMLSNIDLWDVILPLLEDDILTDQEAHEAYNNEYLHETLNYLKFEYLVNGGQNL